MKTGPLTPEGVGAGRVNELIAVRDRSLRRSFGGRAAGRGWIPGSWVLVPPVQAGKPIVQARFPAPDYCDDCVFLPRRRNPVAVSSDPPSLSRFF